MSMGRDREKGFRQAMEAAGLTVNANWILNGDSDMEISEKRAVELAKVGVTAIVAGNDTMAYGALRGLRKAGVKVPGDVALIGIDDLEMSAWTEPALSTVRTHIQQMGEIAAQHVVHRIQTSGTSKTPLRSVPHPELVIRSSCGSK
jgi:LacI family transcriptional regulator